MKRVEILWLNLMFHMQNNHLFFVISIKIPNIRCERNKLDKLEVAHKPSRSK